MVCLAATLQGQAPARFVELHRMLPTTDGVRLAAWGDVDGDGARDIVLLAGGGGYERNGVWRAAGGGRFVAIAGALPLQVYPKAFVLADLDGDGDLDCAMAVAADCSSWQAGCSGGADFVRWNDGTGRFTAPGPALPSDPAVISNAVAAGDVDGDGDVDLVFGCAPHVWNSSITTTPAYGRERGENWLFLNNGNGTFAAANARLGTDTDNTTAVLLEDFDGDGDLDLYAANGVTQGFGGGQDAYYRNDGLGNFTRIVAALPVETDYALAAIALDIDNDGDRDVLLLTAQGIRLLRNNGSGVFAGVAVPALQPGRQIVQVLTGDFDGDGFVDIGLCDQSLYTYDDMHVLQLRNNGAGSFALSPAADRTVSGRALTDDVDGDGDLDLVMLLGGYIDHTLLLNDGTGAWTIVPSEMPPNRGWQHAGAAVDIDRDGDLDVLSCADRSPSMVHRNDGSGRFASVSYGDFTLDVEDTSDLAAGDLDGDGFVDVAVANVVTQPGGRGSQIYHNNGAGRLDRVPVPALEAWAVALGDLDGDGDLDVYYGSRVGVDQVLRNQGNMTFVPIAGAVNDNNPKLSVELGDLDGDGDLDAVLRGWQGAPNRVLLNNGTGVFTPLGSLPNPLDNSANVLLADLDGDGDLDIVVANGPTWPTRFYRNNGSAVFSDSSQDLPPGTGNAISHTAADFDGDGDLDLIECSPRQLQTRLFVNDGLGHFTVVVEGLPEISALAYQFVAGDFDRDGDLDAFMVGQGPANLYWNLRHQLAWRALPRIGRSLTMDLFGTPGEPYAFAASPTRLELPVPPYGVLQIDVGNLLVFEFGVLGAPGRADRTYQVPAIPAFVGANVYWQAITGVAPAFGNLEITTLRAN